MGCATGCVKYLVFIANLIFALGGLALLIIGILYKFSYSDATKVLPSDFGIAPILSIIIGAIVFVTAFLGCCGAVKESTCMLTTYAIILLTIFIVQVAIGIYAFLQFKSSDELNRTIRRDVEKLFNSYNTNPEPVDVTQKFFSCCGVDAATEMLRPNGTYPMSCCSSEAPSCRAIDYNYLHKKGCARAVVELLENSAQIVGGVAIGIAALEIIGAVFALCLVSYLRSHYRTRDIS